MNKGQTKETNTSQLTRGGKEKEMNNT